MRRIVVTGCGSGFGQRIAAALLARGDRVVATDRTLSVMDGALTDPGDGRLERHELDLRAPGSIASATARIVAAGPVDAVVHNAGYAVFNALEDADLDVVSAMFDANVLGTTRVMRGLLGGLRAAGGGTVVVISSVAGRMVFPESGFYAAAKHGLEALAEAWFVEHAAEGLRVALIEPGAFDTGFAARATASSGPRGAGRGEDHACWDARKAEVLSAPQDPARVAAAVLGALDGGPAFQRVPVGDDAERILSLRAVLGDDAFVRLMGERMGGPAEPSMPSVDAVLSGQAGASALQVAKAAASAGFLGHWSSHPRGAEALDRVG